MILPLPLPRLLIRNGRNIFQSISDIVDEMYGNYLSRPNVKQPILTQYCDGRRVTCPNWMSQWGSQSLGEQGYSTIEILRYYYGESIYINTAVEISGVPSSWPGYELAVGASGAKVQQMQEQLNRIAQNYPAIPTVSADSPSKNRRGRHLRPGHKGGSRKISVHFRPSRHRNCGLPDLVQNLGNLCGSFPNCRIKINKSFLFSKYWV